MPPTIAPTPVGPVGPNLLNQKTSIDWARPYVLNGSAKIIRDTAIAIIGDIEGLGGDQIFSLKFLGFVPIKPPWWDTRAKAITDAEGKPALVREALLMMRDYAEFAFWTDRVLGSGRRLADLKSSSAEARALLAREAGYFLHLADELPKAARTVHAKATAELK